MALTTSEAEAVNALLSYLTTSRGVDLGKVTAAEALAAANRLAGGARQKLGRGWRGDGDLERAWPEPASVPPASPGKRWVWFKTSGTADLYELWRAEIPDGADDELEEIREAFHAGHCEFLREEAFEERDRDVIEVNGEVVESSRAQLWLARTLPEIEGE